MTEGDIVLGTDINYTDEQMAEIERRLEDYKNNPDSVVPWEEARERLRRIA